MTNKSQDEDVKWFMPGVSGLKEYLPVDCQYSFDNFPVKLLKIKTTECS